MLQPNQNREIIQYRDYKDVGISYEDSPCKFPSHWHLSAEFVLATKDNCNYEINGRSYKLGEGDILLVWPAELHEVVDTPPGASLILQFSSELITALKDIDLISNRLRNIHLIRKDESSLYRNLHESLLTCYDIYHSTEMFIETQIKLKIVNMLYQIAMFAVNQQISDSVLMNSTSDTYNKVQQACSYIIENCTRALSQQEVADYVGFSIYYFSRIFKEYTDESFNVFLTRHRLEHAVKLLTQDNISITDVAFLSGFQSISNFNKVFLKEMKCSPKEYRKLRQQNEN
jgi:AraC-like DNA-binding protein